MDDNVKIWYDFVSREKEEVNRTRRYCWTLILPFVGGIGWIASSANWDQIDIMATFGIAGLLFLIAVLVLGILNATQKDKTLYEVQYGIVSGRLTDSKQISDEFKLKIGKIVKSASQKGYNDAVDLLSPKI
jgi:hypothetical protein